MLYFLLNQKYKSSASKIPILSSLNFETNPETKSYNKVMYYGVIQTEINTMKILKLH